VEGGYNELPDLISIDEEEQQCSQQTGARCELEERADEQPRLVQWDEDQSRVTDGANVRDNVPAQGHGDTACVGV
jgi:hypothetical protein